MAKKAKARVILVKLLSTAGTGFNYIKSRPRISPKLSMMKYDPMGTIIYFVYIKFITVFNSNHILICSITTFFYFVYYSQATRFIQRNENEEINIIWI